MFWYCGHRDPYFRRDLDRRSSPAAQVRACLSSSHLQRKEKKVKLSLYKVKASKTNSLKGWKGVQAYWTRIRLLFFDSKGHFDSGYVSCQFSVLLCRMCQEALMVRVKVCKKAKAMEAAVERLPKATKHRPGRGQLASPAESGGRARMCAAASDLSAGCLHPPGAERADWARRGRQGSARRGWPSGAMPACYGCSAHELSHPSSACGCGSASSSLWGSGAQLANGTRLFNWNWCWHIPSVPLDCRHLGARRGLVAKFKMWPPPVRLWLIQPLSLCLFSRRRASE